MTVQIKRLLQDISTPEACAEADEVLNALYKEGWEPGRDGYNLEQGKMLIILYKGLPKKKSLGTAELKTLIGMMEMFQEIGS